MLKKYQRFLVKNRNKGIPNLMLYLCLTNALFALYTLFTKDSTVYEVLCYDAEKIFHGQIWRIGTWLLTYGIENYDFSFMSIIYIFFYVMFNNWLGQILESVWGTLRLNLYYFGGALLSVVLSLIITATTGIPVPLSAYYLNLSLFLAVATLIPEERIMLFGVFPIKMRWLALFDVALILLNILPLLAIAVNSNVAEILLMVLVPPLIPIVNYVLTFGKDVRKLLPTGMGLKQRKRRMDFKKAAKPNPNWASNYRSVTGEKPYRHKCSVCGRTDTANPGLEFRYCSRCKGYYCYCIDHINNHTHIEQ